MPPVRLEHSGNAAATTLTALLNAGDLSFTIADATGWPTGAVGPFVVTFDAGSATEERVLCSDRTGSTVNITSGGRGYDSTTDQAHANGAAASHTYSASEADQANEHVVETTTAHGLTIADVVLKDAAQTVTNKDLTDPSNAFAPANILPPGMIAPYAGSSAPTGWLLADGSNVSRSTYADLFAAIGETYGAGNGTTTFTLPNLKGKVAVGRDAADTAFDALGETGGEKTHALSSAELPAHAHTINHGHTASSGTESAAHSHSGSTGGQSASHTHAMGTSDAGGLGGGGTLVRKGGVSGDNTGGASNDHSHSFTTGTESAAHAHGITVADYSGSSGSVGSGTAHNNLQPFVVLNYIVKA